MAHAFRTGSFLDSNIGWWALGGFLRTGVMLSRSNVVRKPAATAYAVYLLCLPWYKRDVRNLFILPIPLGHTGRHKIPYGDHWSNHRRHLTPMNVNEPSVMATPVLPAGHHVPSRMLFARDEKTDVCHFRKQENLHICHTYITRYSL